ncbi:Protein phosphatase 1 regulatory subunit SDS22 [Fusarium oxysporum f. sp. albedinis]|jgi:hypothetical protein|nr:Protein phosphatase 1 regulatory subunit SDS22 [Fusarium oxysporum f. sp. albedinis]
MHANLCRELDRQKGNQGRDKRQMSPIKNLNVTKVESGGAAPALPLSATDCRFLLLFAYLSCFKLNFNAYNDSNAMII